MNIFSLKRFAFQTYGLSFRGKSAVFPLTSGRAALCRRLAFYLFSKVKRSWGASRRPRPPEYFSFSYAHKRGYGNRIAKKNFCANKNEERPQGRSSFLLEKVSDHTACRLTEKKRFFRSLLDGRRGAATSHAPFSEGKTL